MLGRCFKLRSVKRLGNNIAVISQNFSSFKGRKVVRRTGGVSPARRTAAAPPAPLPDADPWTEVVDKQSGQIYYWNTVTNETTPLGAPKPNGDLAAQQPASGGMLGGLGRVVAEGFAFGVGSSVAHGVVGSMFGGSHGSDDSAGGDDSFDL